ncbi:MAG: PLP-dependent aspartate aminotransferase family protein [Thermoplasmatales archaeon]
MKFQTKSIHVGEEPNLNSSGDVVAPIHLSTTFARKEPNLPTAGYEYTRTGNPTRTVLEKKLAAIEEAKYGLAFSSGLAAETTTLLSILKKGDEVLVSDDLYGGTKRLFDKVLRKFDLRFKSVDLTGDFKERIFQGKKAVWIESPSNPLMKIIDIRNIAKISHEHGSLLIVDNTFASPFFQNPLKIGADIVIHSTTKYINGHSDSLGGAVMLNDSEIYDKIKFNQNAIGAVLSPFDSYLTIRGIKTLSIRMERHERNAMEISKYLEEREEVEDVLYPGLSSFKYHRLASEQMSGYGGMLSFYLKANERGIKNFLKNLRYISLAESLGGVESLIEQPYSMTHAGIPAEQRRKAGISENLLRFSVGLEDVSDLIEDLDNAFRKMKL